MHSLEATQLEVQKELTTFWDEKSLYLTKEARGALWKAAGIHSRYQAFLTAWREKSHPDAEKRLEVAFEQIARTPQIIAEGVDFEAMASEPLTTDGKTVTPYGLEEMKEEGQ
jgi:hypothetical protein